MRYTDKLNFITPQIKVFEVMISAPLCESIGVGGIQSYSESESITYGTDD